MNMSMHHHLNLLRRWERSLSLREAITQAVKPGMRVLDAGAGTGVLGMWALQQGAAHVTAIDAADLSLAEALAKDNNLDNRMRFVQSDLGSALRAQERAESDGSESDYDEYDLVLAMLYFNDPRRDEQQSRLIRSLVTGLLSADGDVLPDRVVYHAILCDWPSQDILSRWVDLRLQINQAKDVLGLTFGNLEKRLLATPNPGWFPVRKPDGGLQRADARLLSKETLFTEIKYKNDKVRYPDRLSINVVASGVCNAVIWIQRLFYQDKLIFTNESASWIDNPLSVHAGQSCEFLIDAKWRETNVLSVSGST